MLAGISKRSASRTKNAYQGDSLPGTFGLGSTNVLAQKRAGMMSLDAGVWVSFNIFTVCKVINSFC